MQKLKAMLFDVDGTLLDTSEFIFQAFENTLKKYGYRPPKRSVIAELIGRPLDICYIAVTQSADVQELCASHRSFQAANLHLSKPFPGINKTLGEIKNAGIKMAAVTTRSRFTSIKTLELAAISEYMDYVVAFEDVVNVKPHPEPIFKALDYLDVEPAEAAMVGDTDADIIAGKNAGTATIGVTYGFHGLRIADSDPDYIISSISEILLMIPLASNPK